MRIRTGVRVIVGAFAMCLLATPAAAQAQVDFSAGYQSFTFLEGGPTNIPAGWGASVAVGKAWVKFVGDVSGHYEDHGGHFGKLHLFQGGVELSGKHARFVPFARVLTGVGLFSDLDSDIVWVLTPEAGVKIMANNGIGVQTSVGFPFMVGDGGSTTGLRFFAGIVIRK